MTSTVWKPINITNWRTNTEASAISVDAFDIFSISNRESCCWIVDTEQRTSGILKKGTYKNLSKKLNLLY